MSRPSVPESDASVPASVVPENTERPREKLKFKQTLGREEVAVYLEAIVKGLRKGQIEFRQGAEALSINPAPSLQMAVKAAEKSMGGRLKIELTWGEDGGSSS